MDQHEQAQPGAGSAPQRSNEQLYSERRVGAGGRLGRRLADCGLSAFSGATARAWMRVPVWPLIANATWRPRVATLSVCDRRGFALRCEGPRVATHLEFDLASPCGDLVGLF